MLSSQVRVVAVLAGLLLSVPAYSYAQGPGGGGRGFGGGGRGGFGRGGGSADLLRIEEVQKEIGVTEEQKTELAKVVESLRTAERAGGFNREEYQKLTEEERTKRREEFEKLTEEERTKRFEEMDKQRQERSKKADESIKALLKPEQWTRLSELRLQREGVRSWSREDVQKQLGLTEEQVAKVKTLTSAQGPDFRDLSSEEEIAKLREEMKARREAFDKGMAEVLTEDQKATWTKLQGTKFEFPQRGGGRGPGSGGRRRPL